MSLNLYLGGTFDPVHFGHINLATVAYERLGEKIIWLPCNKPIHKNQPDVGFEHRLNMLRLVVDSRDEWEIDLSDVENKPQSTFELFSKKKICNNCLLIGTDSLLTLTSWHDWELLSVYLHLVVLNRYDSSLVIPQDVLRFFKLVKNKDDLLDNPSGCLMLLEGDVCCVSSTSIRSLFVQREEYYIVQQYLPSKVLQYIIDNKLYTESCAQK